MLEQNLVYWRRSRGQMDLPYNGTYPDARCWMRDVITNNLAHPEIIVTNAKPAILRPQTQFTT
jgi:hypothetical protein